MTSFVFTWSVVDVYSWRFGGKLASVFMVAFWIAWMLKWLEKGVCQSYGKARGNLAFFWPLQHPRDSDCHPEGGGSTFLQNFRLHKYHKPYKSARPPPNKKTLGLPHCEMFSTPCYFLSIWSRHSSEHYSQMHQHIQVIVWWVVIWCSGATWCLQI